jgi:A/G-specific adenine glycosylase
MSLLEGLDFPSLTDWFLREGRTYPWSLTHDPYEIWISEVMLQQTTVQTVLRRYERWLSRWPNLEALAQAKEEEVLREWEGLGYYSRGLALLRTSQKLLLQGGFPQDPKNLLQFPGIGPYTAAAVASFAFAQPCLTLDANLKRVFQRLAAEPSWTKALENEVLERAKVAFKTLPSREVNQGLMQLGQLVCRPRAPHCQNCPLVQGCRAFQTGRTEEIPQRASRTIENLSTDLGVFYRRSAFGAIEFFVAHPGQGRFSRLWAFPPSPPKGNSLTPRFHTYTRYKDRLTPWLSSETGSPALPEGWTGSWFSEVELEKLGMPSVHRKILAEALSLLKNR